jgi:hypothetical protein
MKLGIVVVYLYGAEQEPLLELHLRQIEKCTTVPYVIYGGAGRLEPEYRRRLADHPRVRVPEIPPTELRGKSEHSYYLDRLIRIAIDDGATHVVTMHLDSFPVRAGWIEDLMARLTGTCVMATVEGINTACLFFGRDFYVGHAPTMLVSEAVRAGPKFREFVGTRRPKDHSGIGYGFAAFAHDLTWNELRLTSGDDGHACVYDDRVFHLVGMLRLETLLASGEAQVPSGWNRAVGRRLMPQAWRSGLRRCFPSWFNHAVDQPRTALAIGHRDRLLRELLQDPEVFLTRLRRGGVK